MAWKRDKNTIAERFMKDELPGFLTKEFDAKGDEFVVLEKNGEIYLERDHGTLSVSSFTGDFTDILMVDKSEKTLENEIKSVFLSDGRSIGMKLTIKFRIFNSDRFSKNLMGQRKRLFLDDVWNEVVSDVMYKKILPKLQKKPAKDFASGDFRERARADIETGVKKKFRGWGLMLISLSTNFSVPDEHEDAEEEEIKWEEPESAEKHAKPGMTLEDEAEELEKERLEREVAMELEKKQMQKDAEDAMEAMELKDIQERKKALREKEAKEDETDKLAEELESLKRAKEITERKFYKKELSEESFQRMMEDFEKRIIEIETRLRKK
jgi:hypothetical protein